MGLYQGFKVMLSSTWYIIIFFSFFLFPTRPLLVIPFPLTQTLLAALRPRIWSPPVIFTYFLNLLLVKYQPLYVNDFWVFISSLYLLSSPKPSIMKTLKWTFYLKDMFEKHNSNFHAKGYAYSLSNFLISPHFHSILGSLLPNHRSPFSSQYLNSGAFLFCSFIHPTNISQLSATCQTLS